MGLFKRDKSKQNPTKTMEAEKKTGTIQSNEGVAPAYLGKTVEAAKKDLDLIISDYCKKIRDDADLFKVSKVKEIIECAEKLGCDVSEYKKELDDSIRSYVINRIVPEIESEIAKLENIQGTDLKMTFGSIKMRIQRLEGFKKESPKAFENSGIDPSAYDTRLNDLLTKKGITKIDLESVRKLGYINYCMEQIERNQNAVEHLSRLDEDTLKKLGIDPKELKKYTGLFAYLESLKVSQQAITGEKNPIGGGATIQSQDNEAKAGVEQATQTEKLCELYNILQDPEKTKRISVSIEQGVWKCVYNGKGNPEEIFEKITEEKKEFDVCYLEDKGVIYITFPEHLPSSSEPKK